MASTAELLAIVNQGRQASGEQPIAVDITAPVGGAQPAAQAQPGATVDDLVQIANERDVRQPFQPEPFTRNEPPPDAGINPIEGNVQALMQGATLGFADEIQAVIAATIAAPFIEDKTFGQIMTDARKQFRADKEQFREQEGVAALVPEAIGALATGGIGILGRATLPGAIAAGGVEGAAAGAGFADVPEEEGGFFSPQTGLETAIGTGLGLAAGVASPFVGAGLATIPQLAQKAKGLFPNASGAQQRYIQQIEAGEVVDDDLAQYILNGANKLEADPLLGEATTQGIQPGTINAIKGSSTADKAKIDEMVNIIEKGKANANFAKTNRAGAVAGKTFADQYDFVLKTNKQAGTDINKAARALKGQPADISAPLGQFQSKLDELGVVLTTNKKGNVVPDFEDSILAKGDRGPIKEVIRFMNALGKRGQPDALSAHQLKRAIDNNVTYGKANSLSRDAEDLLKGLRSGVDEVLDTNFPSYNEANQVYSETIEVLNGVRSVSRNVAAQIEGGTESADEAVGVLLRRLMSNAQSRAPLMDSITAIERMGKKHGNTSDESAIFQAFVVDDLETLFGTQATTSFRGEIGKGIQDVIPGQTTVIGAAGKVLDKAQQLKKGISDENAIKVLRKLTSR